jgi:CRP-like cAMP-binding protein
LKNLASERELRHFPKKNIIYNEGSAPRYLYYIQKGKIKTFKTNEDGKDLIINILGEKEIFGHIDLLGGGNYTESVAALEDCELILIPKEDFFILLHANKDVSAKFIKMLASNVSSKEAQLLNLAYNSVRKRVADALTILHSRYGVEPISMLREDLAALAGTAKETVIRTLTDFREEKMIDVEDGRITILKADKLRNLTN